MTSSFEHKPNTHSYREIGTQIIPTSDESLRHAVTNTWSTQKLKALASKEKNNN